MRFLKWSALVTIFISVEFFVRLKNVHLQNIEQNNCEK